MTRTLTILAVLLLIAFIGSLIIGFAAVAPAMLIVGLLCAMPLFMLSLGAVLGRVSNELTITRKERPIQVQPSTRVNPNRREQRIPENLG
jgi:hypothetical protein